jgi:hypothetical protein
MLADAPAVLSQPSSFACLLGQDGLSAAVGRRDGERGRMATSVLALVVDCRDSRSQASWWAATLGRRVSERNPGEYEVYDASGTSIPLYFMNVPEPRSSKNRLHLDITTAGPLDDLVAQLVAAGATLVEMRQDPATYANPDTWAVLQDPEGNEFCVLNADSVTGLT